MVDIKRHRFKIITHWVVRNASQMHHIGHTRQHVFGDVTHINKELLV